MAGCSREVMHFEALTSSLQYALYRNDCVSVFQEAVTKASEADISGFSKVFCGSVLYQLSYHGVHFKSIFPVQRGLKVNLMV